MLKSTHLVCYLDNDAARAALCKGYGSNELAQRIVGCTMQLESRFKTKSWYARVPSHSNISDGPSRLDCREVEHLGSKQIEIDWEIILENLFGVSGASSKRGKHGHTEWPPTALVRKKCVSVNFRLQLRFRESALFNFLFFWRGLFSVRLNTVAVS